MELPTTEEEGTKTVQTWGILLGGNKEPSGIVQNIHKQTTYNWNPLKTENMIKKIFFDVVF